MNYTGAESNNIMINNFGVVGESNVCRIGAATGSGMQQLTQTFIAGIRGTTTVNNDAVAVLVDSAGQLGTVSSSLRYKENVRDMEDLSESIFALRPVIFNYKDRDAEDTSIGLIAEEVAEVLPSLVVYDKMGKPDTVKYQDLPVLLLNELIRQQLCIENLYERIELLEESLRETTVN